MSVFTAAGTTVAIGDALPATYDKAGFEAVTWTVIGELTDFPEFGKAFNLVTHNPLGNRGTQKLKGSFSHGSNTIQYAFDPEDTGQDAVVTAVESDSSLPIRVVLQDDTHIYTKGKFMSAPINIGTVDNMVMRSTQVEYDGDALFEDAPTP